MQKKTNKNKKSKYVPYPEKLYVKDNGENSYKTIRDHPQELASNYYGETVIAAVYELKEMVEIKKVVEVNKTKRTK